MLNGAPATQQCFQTSSVYAGLLASDLDGSTPPPPGSPNFLLAFGSNVLQLWKFHVNWTTPANSTFSSSPTNIPVAAFSEACSGGTCIPQLGTTNKLDSLGDRLMYRLAYPKFGDHESLVVNHSVTAGTSVGVRWYEVRNPGSSPSLYQQGTYAPDSQYRWMGSIAMDQSGNMAPGYSLSSSGIYPAIAFMGWLFTDTLGTMGTETFMMNGGGEETGGLSRWGGYSAMTIDPVDDCTFWYTNECEPTSGLFNWSTRIASFKFPQCGTVATQDFTISATPPSQTVAAGAVATFSPPTGNNGSGSSSLMVTTGTAASNSSFLITGTSGTLVHSTSAQLIVTAAPAVDFSISINPGSRTISRGGSTTYSITISASNGFRGTVSLSASGLPAHTSASFSPANISGGAGTSTMTVTTAKNPPGNISTITVNATSGSLSHSSTATLN